MAATPDPDTRRRRGGCGIAAVMALIIMVLTIYVVGRPVREAKHAEQLVNDRFGYAPTFAPQPDGRVPLALLEEEMGLGEYMYI